MEQHRNIQTNIATQVSLPKSSNKDIGDRAAYSIAESAAMIGVCRDVIYKEIALGRLRSLKIGRRTIVPAAELHRFLSELPPLRLKSA